MGQAAVDLPDSLSPPPASAASTDDLLAQMAGEEIDRLLAEQDGERPAKPATIASAPIGVPSAAAEAPNTAASQLDGFLGGLATESGPDPVAELAGASRSPAAGTAHDANRPDPLDDHDVSAERGALNASGGAAQVATGDSAASLPVRILAWINSPLDSCPDPVREAVGKVAILTAVNAVAVLVYVLFFRHH